MQLIDYKEKNMNANNKLEFNNEIIKNTNKTFYNIKSDLNLTYSNEEKKLKINQIMKFKDFSLSQNNKCILKSLKQINRINNKNNLKKFNDLYSPINKIIDKEYSNLFDWIEGNNQHGIKKNTSRLKIRYKTEERSIESDKINNDTNDNNIKINNILKNNFFLRTTPQKIRIKKVLKLNSENKNKNADESCKTIMNLSYNKDKKENKALSVKKTRCNNNTYSSKRTRYNNDLNYREYRLKRLFTKFLNNAIYSENKTNKRKEKINIKKDIKFNIISNIDKYNNLTSSGSHRINFFLCSENTKKEYGIEQSNIFINNKILPYYCPNNIQYKKKYIKLK